jgi:two-component system cell cycle sensor histidine kinase/response regulator CckA
LQDLLPSTDSHPALTPVILLVEDEEPIRELIGMALSNRGYEVHICAESSLALGVASALPVAPHLLITDIHMAGLTGPELAGQMVAAFPGLHILFVSGYAATSPPVQAALAFKNSVFMRKPFSLHDFRAQVDGVLATASASPA